MISNLILKTERKNFNTFINLKLLIALNLF